MTQPAKAPRDWDAVERDYRAGAGSVNDLARRYNIPDRTIRSRAQTLRWTRPDTPIPDPRIRRERDIKRLSRLRDTLSIKARTLVETAQSVREIADAASAVERLGRITARLMDLERRNEPPAPQGGDTALAHLLKKARDRTDAQKSDPER